MSKHFAVSAPIWCEAKDEIIPQLEFELKYLRPRLEKWFEIISLNIIWSDSHCNGFIKGHVKKLNTWSGYEKPKLKKVLLGKI